MLGLLAGVVGVVTIAVVYYQKTPTATAAPTPNTAPINPVANYPTPANTPAK